MIHKVKWRHILMMWNRQKKPLTHHYKYLNPCAGLLKHDAPNLGLSPTLSQLVLMEIKIPLENLFALPKGALSQEGFKWGFFWGWENFALSAQDHTTAGIKHLQTKAQSCATLNCFPQIISYIISKPFLHTVIIPITFLNLPMKMLNILVAFHSLNDQEMA